jgi:hypothetical protein
MAGSSSIHILLLSALVIVIYAITTTTIFDLKSGRTYPLNLSISISGGKETNKDSLSNCE